MIGPTGRVALHRRHGLGNLGGRQGETDTPPRHGVGLGCTVNDHRLRQEIVRQIEHRRRRARGVMDPAIDLIGDHPDFTILCPLGDGTQLRRRIDRAGGVVGRTQHQTPGVRVRRLFEILHADLESELGITRHGHRIGTGQVDHLGIGHPRRRRYQHAVVRPEQREARVVGVDRPATRQHRQVACRGGAQVENAGVRRVVRLPLLDGVDAGVGRDARRVEIRLPRRQVDDVLTGGPTPGRFLGHRQGRRRLELSDVT